MRIIKFLLSLCIVLAGIFFIGGMFISDDWMVSRSTVINASTEQIYPYISNFKEIDKWIPWNSSKDSTLKYTYEGPESGVGAKQSWTSEKMGTGSMQITEANPQTGIRYDLYIDMGHSQSTLHGNIALSQEANATKVTWTDKGNSGKSFLKRWMSVLFKPVLGNEFNKGLASLKALVEKK